MQRRGMQVPPWSASVQVLFGEGAAGWQLGLVQGSLWSPQWGAVTTSIVSVVHCHLGRWSFIYPFWAQAPQS